MLVEGASSVEAMFMTGPVADGSLGSGQGAGTTMRTAVRADSECRQRGSRAPGRLDPAPDQHVPLAAAPRVLLLNASYEALTALPARRAVVMLLGGKADVVHDNPKEIEGQVVDMSIHIPSIIRLILERHTSTLLSRSLFTSRLY